MQQVLLRGEVVVHAGLREAGRLGDVEHGGALVAPLGEHLARGGEHRRRLVVMVGGRRSGHRPTVCPVGASDAGSAAPGS